MKPALAIFLFALNCVPLFAAPTAAVATETWRVSELAFTASKDYTTGGGDALFLDVVYTHSASGTTLSRPAFWDGGRTFRVRFAPTLAGEWTYRTRCANDAALNGRTGKLSAVPYAGKLEIYRRGFVRSVPGLKYFTYADGKPFFYLGDTHWGMYREELDEPGPHAGKSGATSHVKHIIDRRVAQGFTVYQSEPVDCPFKLHDGRVDAADLPGLQKADRYYQLIADAGLVHANAELCFTTLIYPPLMNDRPALERLARYWVARFGAYPVMWTLAQETDNDLYRERGDQRHYDSRTNPWLTVAEFLHKHDAYRHPLSGHQENAYFTTVTGLGTTVKANTNSNYGASAFLPSEVTRRTGHNWWAAQWQPRLITPLEWGVARDYYASPKPAVLFEGRYCHLWTKDFGARVQGWIAFLNGFCGYGYGAVDIWLYKSTYDTKSTSLDGYESIGPQDKAKHWSEAVEFPSAHQMTLMRQYLEKIEWWKLSPDLGFQRIFTPDPKGIASCANLGDSLFLCYFNGTNTITGTLHGLNPQRKYAGEWFNPRTGKTASASPLAPTANGDCRLPPKPSAEDWVLKVSAQP